MDLITYALLKKKIKETEDKILGEGLSEDLDTVQELADWIKKHDSSIEPLKELLNSLPKDTTLIDYITSSIHKTLNPNEFEISNEGKVSVKEIGISKIVQDVDEIIFSAGTSKF